MCLRSKGKDSSQRRKAAKKCDYRPEGPFPGIGVAPAVPFAMALLCAEQELCTTQEIQCKYHCGVDITLTIEYGRIYLQGSCTDAL